MRVAEYIFSKLWEYLFDNEHYLDAYLEIATEYEADYREYHNFSHIEEMVIYLWEAEWPKGAEGEREKFTAILAAFFHDFDNPRHKYAEIVSGALCRSYAWAWANENQFASQLTFRSIVEDADRAICDTATHVSETLVGQMLIDADLRRFVTGDWRKWARQIRLEYGEHSDEDFNAGRLAVLNKFRFRKPFFYFAQHEDCEAYRRLDEQIAELENQSG